MSPTTRHYLQPPIPTHPPVWGPELLPSAGQWREEVCSGVQWCSRGVRLQWGSPQGPLQQCLWWAPQLMEDEGARPPDVWGICWVSGMFPSYGGWCASGGGRRSCRAPSGGWRSHSVPTGGRQSCSAPWDSWAGTQAGGFTYEVGTGSWHSKTGFSQGGSARSRARSVPWAHGVRSRARSFPGSPQSPLHSREPTEPAPFCEPTESAPEPVPWAHVVHSRARSFPGSPQRPLHSREPTEPAPFREPTESAHETAPFKWLLSAPPWWHPTLLAPP